MITLFKVENPPLTPPRRGLEKLILVENSNFNE